MTESQKKERKRKKKEKYKELGERRPAPWFHWLSSVGRGLFSAFLYTFYMCLTGK